MSKDIKISKEDMDMGWYILEFLNAFMKKYDIPVENWVKLVKKYSLATRLVDTFDCVQELEPDTYAIWLNEYLENKGVDINEYK